MDILIEESDGGLWAAALENGALNGLEVDPPHEQVRWGTIYLATVKTIDAARDAAYLDLDGTNTGILYNKNIRITDQDGIKKGGDIAIGKLIAPGDHLIVQAKTAYLQSSNDITIKEQKIPELSMDIAIQGRHIIHCPLMNENRLSKRITDKKLRTQIKKMMQSLEEQANIKGCILRAAAAHTQTDILRREAEVLINAWDHITNAAQDISTPQAITVGPDAIQRILSDHANQHIENIEITTLDHMNYAEEWCAVFAPDLIPKITPVELEDASDELALFYYRDIMGQIEDLFQPYCILNKGGNIIIQHTAALTVIDVNKGGDSRGHIATNIDAGIEALRQIRLRNIGGVILIDLITLKNKKDQQTILDTIIAEAEKDPCTVQIHGFTGTGLLEITRARRTPPMAHRVNIENF